MPSIFREMERKPSVRLVEDVYCKNRIDLPETSGIYAFWWMGSKEVLMGCNRSIVLKGPKEVPVKVEYKDWWPISLPYPCLYVGKSTNIKKRFGLHIKGGSKGRIHKAFPNNIKGPPKTSSCQLRHGIEHIFPIEEEPLPLIRKYVGFSYNSNFSKTDVAERFYEEDLLIGLWRPWFNVDSER